MSVLRFLSPARRSRSSSPTSPSDAQPSLHIEVPALGVLYISQSEGPPSFNHEAEAWSTLTHDHELKGEITVNLPRGCHGGGGRWCKGIKVGLKSWVRLDMNGHQGRKGWEEDVIFERELELGTDDGLWLDRGISRFAFTFVLPTHLGPHDQHPQGKIWHDLWAEVRGTDADSSCSCSRSSKPPTSPKTIASRGRSRPISPLSSPPLSDMSPISASQAEETSLPSLPSYETSERLWLGTTLKASREIRPVYNPHPSGEVNQLDERLTGTQDGIGPFELRMSSDIWAVGSLMRTRFTFLDPNPKTKIHSWRINLETTLQVTSPRDNPPAPWNAVKSHVITKQGHWDATPLWSGRQAGGKDQGEVQFESMGRLPFHEATRPSTVSYIITPLRVSHQLTADVFFSVYGEDVQGNPLKRGGEGKMRQLRLEKRTMIPNCVMVPQIMNLPSYELTVTNGFSNRFDIACPLCHTPIEDKLCVACPTGTPPHPRHNHSPELVGNAEGVCPACSRTVMPEHTVGKNNCLCSVSTAELLKYTKGFGDDEGRAVSGRKEDYEARQRERQ